MREYLDFSGSGLGHPTPFPARLGATAAGPGDPFKDVVSYSEAIAASSGAESLASASGSAFAQARRRAFSAWLCSKPEYRSDYR